MIQLHYFIYICQQFSVRLYHLLLLLFRWLFPSSGIAAMVVDRLIPVSPVSSIALSQSYSLHVPLAHILPPCLWSPSLRFPRYRFRHHSSHYVIFFHPHDVPIPFQSSLRYISGRLHYFRRSSDVFVLILSFLVTPHIHLSILISFTSILDSCRLVVAQVSAPCSIAGLTTVL